MAYYQVSGSKSARKRFATAVVLGVAGLSAADKVHGAQTIFDSFTSADNDGDYGYFGPNRFSGTTGFPGTQSPLTTTQEGMAITIPAGTASIGAFDLAINNATNAFNSAGAGVGTTFTSFQVNAYFWGTVNNGTVNASSPAFSNLLGSDSFNVPAPAADGSVYEPGYIFFFRDGYFALPTPVALNGATEIGVTFELQASTDGTTFAPVAGVEPGFTQGSAFNAGNTATNATYINVNGEQNGNFQEAPLAVYNKGTGVVYPYQAVITTIYGPPQNFYWTATTGDFNFSTGANWSPAGVPGTVDTANFNLGSSGYTVNLPNAFTQIKGASVQNDNVTLDLPGSAGQVYISNTLTIGQPATGTSSVKGTLSVTNSLNNQTNLFEAGAVAVGGNGGTGVLNIGQSIYFYTDNDTAINAGSSVVVQFGGKLETNTLTIAGTTNAWTGSLDIGQSAMMVTSGNITTVMNQVRQGYNNGKWTGKGITSSAAAADTMHLTAVGVIVNNNGSGVQIYGSGTTLGIFDASNELGNVDNPLNAVLLKYTYYGDANLDGTVDGSDYTLIDNGFTNHLTGWYNGDFNYDGKVDGSDYTLIDNAFNAEGATLISSDGERARSSETPVDSGSFSSEKLPGEGGIATSTTQFASVPEPASLGLLAMAAIPLLGRRSRRRLASRSY